MIVVDVSAALEFLLQTSLGLRVEARLLRDGDELHAPHLVDVEVLQGLRRLVRTGEVSALRADDAMYVALAEAIDAPLVTCDGPLANAPGHHARIEVID